MRFFIETERLILRDLLPTDDAVMFELDSNATVHRYLGNNPIKTIEEARNVIAIIQEQYARNGIGRWATIEKASGDFIGWSGLKHVTDATGDDNHYYDVGYRLIPRYWGKGYATEAAKAALEYGFTTMNLEEVIGTANVENIASRKALEKCGLQFVKNYMWNDIKCDWLKITKQEWMQRNRI